MTVVWHGEALSKKVIEAAMDGCEEWARVDVMPQADEDCPVDTGTLRSTHAVVREDKKIELGYGGPAAPYALRQHEDMTLSHPVGKAKWLEDSFNQNLPELPEKIKRRIAL